MIKRKIVRDKMKGRIESCENEVKSLEAQLNQARMSLSAAKLDLRDEMRLDYTTDEILGPPRFLPNGCHEFTDHDDPILLYMDSFYIDVTDEGGEAGYHLVLLNDCYESQCLRELEDLLAEYVLSEGQCWIEL